MNLEAVAGGFWRRYQFGLTQHGIAADDVQQEAAILVLRHGADYRASWLWADLFDWMRTATTMRGRGNGRPLSDQAARSQPLLHVLLDGVQVVQVPDLGPSAEDAATAFLAVMQATDDLLRSARIVLRMIALGATLREAGAAAGVTESRACQVVRGREGRIVAARLTAT